MLWPVSHSLQTSASWEFTKTVTSNAKTPNETLKIHGVVNDPDAGKTPASGAPVQPTPVQPQPVTRN
jgi:hypothetical protein